MNSHLLNRTAILMMVLCGGPGCTPTAEPEPVEVVPQKSPEQIARELEKIRQAGFQTRFDGISKAIRTSPDRFDEWIGHLEDLVYASEGTRVELKAKNLLSQQLQYREDEGKKSLDNLTAQVERLIAEGDPLAAERILEEFDPDGTYEKTAAHQGWKDLQEQVAIRQRAEVDFDRITRRARAYRRQEELAEAIGLLESFSDEYKGTKEYDEVVETIAEYLSEYEVARAAQQEQLSIEWIDLPIDQYLSSFRASTSDPDATAWTAEGGEAIGNNTSTGLAQLEIGEDSWEEYSVEMEIQLISGDSINLGITAGMRPGAGIKNYDVHSFDAEEEEWLRIRIELKEGLIRLTDLDSLERLDEDTRPYFPAGGIAVLLKPDDSVRLRNIRYKVFRPVPGEEEAPEDGAEDDTEG